MEDKPEKVTAKKHFIKIVIPIIIVAIVGAIWVFKNANVLQLPVVANNLNPASDPVSASAHSDENPDFALHFTGNIDLVKLQEYGLPIMINFGAKTCEPCREVMPILEELNRELQGKVIVKYVDIAEYREFAAQFPFTLVPTQFFFDQEGKPFMPQDAEKMKLILHYNEDTGELKYTSHRNRMTKEEILAVFKEMGVE